MTAVCEQDAGRPEVGGDTLGAIVSDGMTWWER